MSTFYNIRFTTNPKDFCKYDTEQLRDHFLIKDLFISNKINLLYSHYDRFIIGGVKPGATFLNLESIPPLKAENFLDRRELGIINIGDTGIVTVDGKDYSLKYKEALYVGKGSKNVAFKTVGNKQALFYLNSAPAHKSFPIKRITQKDSELVELGSLESSNHRIIRKLIVNSIVDTCQLQMGMTELKTGSIWNTMPAHVHD